MKPHLLVNKKQIGLIHVAKADLVAKGILDDDGYRDLLRQYRRVNGRPVESSKELTEAQADVLLAYFKKCGWVYVPKVKKAPPIRKQRRDKQVILEAIRTTLGALNKDWGYAEGIARQMKFPAKLEWCTAEQLHKIYVALVYQERRDAGDPPAPRPETRAKRRAVRAAARTLEEDIPF